MHKSNPKDTNGAGGVERAQTASRPLLRRVAAQPDFVFARNRDALGMRRREFRRGVARAAFGLVARTASSRVKSVGSPVFLPTILLTSAKWAIILTVLSLGGGGKVNRGGLRKKKSETKSVDARFHS